MKLAKKLTFSMVIFPFQFLMLALFAGFASYRDIPKHGSGSNYISDHYPLFQDVHVMVCFGVGFLLTFLKKHGYASLTYNFMLVAIVAQWSTLVDPVVTHLLDKTSGPGVKFEIGIEELINGDFTAAVVLITWCVVIGKTSRLQLLVIALIEPVFYAISKAIIYNCLGIADAGSSITIHFFAAYYGLALSYVIGNYTQEHDNLITTYQSDIYCMAGTLFLWIYWPSFNSCELGGLEAQQMRAIVNTYYSLAACLLATVGLAPLLNKDYKIEMVYIQNSSLAGGVAAGMVANMLIQPWGAICVGLLAGVVSTLGFAYMTDLMRIHLKIHDTAGVQNLHSFPALISAIASAIATAAVKPESYPSLEEYQSIYPMVNTTINPTGNRTPSSQAWYQLSSIPIAFGIAVIGGIFNGYLIKHLDHPDEDELYDEKSEFERLPLLSEELPLKTDVSNTTSEVQSYCQQVEKDVTEM